MLEHDEKIEILQLIRENWGRINANFAESSLNKHSKRQAWQYIWAACNAKGHKWTMDKDSKWLSGICWPKIYDNYKKKKVRQMNSTSGKETRVTDVDLLITEIVGEPKELLTPELGAEIEAGHDFKHQVQLQNPTTSTSGGGIKRKVEPQLHFSDDNESDYELDVGNGNSTTIKNELSATSSTFLPLSAGIKKLKTDNGDGAYNKFYKQRAKWRMSLSDLEFQHKQILIQSAERQLWLQELQIVKLEIELGLPPSNPKFIIASPESPGNST